MYICAILYTSVIPTAHFFFYCFCDVQFVFLVGAMSGVFAAGASHFSPDKWKQSFIVLAIIILGLGSLQGWLTGFLFRAYAEQLYTNNLVHGIAGGVITYLMTFLRGRQLANKEGKGSL